MKGKILLTLTLCSSLATPMMADKKAKAQTEQDPNEMVS